MSKIELLSLITKIAHSHSKIQIFYRFFTKIKIPKTH